MRRPAILKHPLTLVASAPGSLHCVPAAVMMAVRSITGRELSWGEAEELTGYVPGRGTWPYETCLSLAREFGLSSRIIEILDPEGILNDPLSEIQKAVGDPELARAELQDMDVEAEQERIRRCLENPMITFDVHSPTTEDVEIGIDEGWLPLVSLDYAILNQSDRFESHRVVVSGVSDDRFEIFDPGPPGDAARIITRRVLDRAIHSPVQTSGAITLVGYEKQ